MIKNKKGVTEATIFYIIAIALGILLVILYIIFIGPNSIIKDITNAFGGFQSAVLGNSG